MFDRIIYRALNILGISQYIDDKSFIKLQFKAITGENLNLCNPSNFNMKLQWLKLYDRKDLYTKLVDKYLVKEYVKDVIGLEDIIIPTLKVYDTTDEIVINELPEKFVLKTNHSGDSSGVFICKDKESFDFKSCYKKLTLSLKTDYYKAGREWPYKNVKRKIIAEKYIEDKDGELHDYKFFCFNGIVRFFKIDYGRHTQHQANYYDRNGCFMDCGEVLYHGNQDEKLDIPSNLSDMVSIAEKLAKNLPFVRVDLYNVSGKIYFGELTLFPAGGFAKYYPDGFCETIGGWLDLSKLKK